MKAIFTLDDTITAGGGHAIYTSLHNVENPGQYVLICPPGELAGKVSSQIKVETVPKKRSTFSIIRNIRRILKSYPDITVFHVHGISALPLAILSILGKKIKLEYTEHLLNREYKLARKSRQRIQKIGYFFAIRFCSHIYCVSQAVQSYVTSTFLYPSKKTSVVYNVVPRYQAEPKKHSKGDRVKLLSVGTLNAIKYFDGLIQVMAQLPITYQLEIIGEGEQRVNLQKQIDDLRLGDRITLLGNMDHDEVIAKMNESDVYCSTSRSESFGFTIAEAMAVGLPVVAFRVGGIPELVIHEKTGFLVEPYDLLSFAAAVKTLGSTVSLRNQFGAAGFEYLERFPRTQLYIS